MTRILAFLTFMIVGRGYALSDKQFKYSTNGPVLEHTESYEYSYAPSFLYDPVDKKYKVWTCYAREGMEGDYVSYQEADTIETLYKNWEQNRKVVFRGSGIDNSHDREHTCDPNILEVDGKFYLYYGGLTNSNVQVYGGDYTQVGVAVSSDRGKSFKRVHNGQSILEVNTEKKAGSSENEDKYDGGYGLGQPAVIKHPEDGLYYMFYTLVDPPKESIIKVIRSSDPTFPRGNQELLRKYQGHEFGGVSIDAAIDPETKEILIIVNNTDGNLIYRLDNELNIIGLFNFEFPEKTPFGEGISALTDPKKNLILNHRTGHKAITFVGAEGDVASPYENIRHVAKGLYFHEFIVESESRDLPNVVIKNNRNDCPSSYQRVAWMDVVFGTEGYGFDHGKDSWAFCSLGTRSQPKTMLKHASNDCPSGYSRVAWLGSVKVGADGFDYFDGNQNWALCSKVEKKVPLTVLKHSTKDCPKGYNRVAWLGGVHAGADGFTFESGPQNWALCTLNEKFTAGCTNPAASNYNSLAQVDDKSCIVPGCTNSSATNYNPLATSDNGSCKFSAALIKHISRSCPSGYSEVASISNIHAGADGYGYAHGPQNWRICSRSISGRSAVLLKHSSKDCSDGYARVAWLGSIIANADGFSWSNGGQDWALCSLSYGGTALITLKHASNDCASGYHRNAWLGSIHAGADGYGYAHGPQDWAFCSK